MNTTTSDLKRLVVHEFADGDPVKPERKVALKDACRVCTLLDDPPVGEFRRPQAHDKTRLHTDTIKTDKAIRQQVAINLADAKVSETNKGKA